MNFKKITLFLLVLLGIAFSILSGTKVYNYTYDLKKEGVLTLEFSDIQISDIEAEKSLLFARQDKKLFVLEVQKNYNKDLNYNQKVEKYITMEQKMNREELLNELNSISKLYQINTSLIANSKISESFEDSFILEGKIATYGSIQFVKQINKDQVNNQKYINLGFLIISVLVTLITIYLFFKELKPNKI